jgi:hypothetical protein
MEVASNWDSPATALAGDDCCGVRTRVAQNPDTDATTLTKLAQDPTKPLLDTFQPYGRTHARLFDVNRIKSSVAEHPNTQRSPTALPARWRQPEREGDMLARLAHDALASCTKYDDQIDQIDESNRVCTLVEPVAANPNTPPQVLVKLAAVGWKEEVARNPSTPPELLLELAEQWHHSLGYEDECLALAGNRTCPTKRSRRWASFARSG